MKAFDTSETVDTRRTASAEKSAARIEQVTRDAWAVMAVACIGVGVWMIYVPAALIVVGGLILVGCIVGQRTRGTK